jgi:hypothetical protein
MPSFINTDTSITNQIQTPRPIIQTINTQSPSNTDGNLKLNDYQSFSVTSCLCCFFILCMFLIVYCSM